MSDRSGSSSGALTVHELVYDSGLGLTAVTGEAGLGRVIKGIHFTDADDPVQFLTSESVLVTTGRSWSHDVDIGLYQLGRLASIDAAALVVATGYFVDKVPPALAARARKLRLPILEMPPGTLSRTVISYVYHALASADLHLLRRTVALQNDLLDLLLAEAGFDELLAKVSSLLGMPMMLLDGTGSVTYDHGVPDAARRAREVWDAWGELTDANALGIVEIGTSRFFCREVLLHGKWSGSSSPRPRRHRAPCSSTWLCRSCSGSSRWTCSSAATRSSPRGACAAGSCATC